MTKNIITNLEHDIVDKKLNLANVEQLCTNTIYKDIITDTENAITNTEHQIKNIYADIEYQNMRANELYKLLPDDA